MFDKLPALAPPKAADLGSEVDQYLSSDVEHVTDPLAWWHARRGMYPQLSRMALNYLSIPGKSILKFRQASIDRLNIFTATSIDVERLFSRGRLLLSHVRSCLSAQSTRALLCLGMWSELNLIMDDDVKTVSELQDVEGNEEVILEDGWDRITVK